jgi:hypothetical protein
MEDVDRKYIIDTSSLVKFVDYYYFDKNNSREVYNKLNNFLISKIKSGEIVIIDKVFEELYENRRNKNLKTKMEPCVVDTLYLFDSIEDILNKYYKVENERFFKDQDAIDREKANIENSADLYLIAYGNELKSDPKVKPVIVTDEKRTFYQKLIEKIPTICKHENLECRDLPYLLFEIYKSELNFKLN